MEFKLMIDNQEFDAIYKGLTCRIYREQFQEDLFLRTQEIRNEYIKRIRELVDKDEKDIDVGLELLNISGTNYMERIVWAVLKSANKNMKSFESFVDDIENYDSFMSAGITVYEKIVYGNQQTVDPITDDEEQQEENKSKKNKN